MVSPIDRGEYQRAQTRPADQSSPRRAHAMLRAGLRSGGIVAREQLVEDSLRRTMAITRTSIRIALRMLADEALVDRSPRRGTTVVQSIAQIPVAGDRADPTRPDPVRYRGVPLEAATVPTTGVVRDRLRTDAASVRMSEGLVLADDEPFAIETTYHAVGTALGWPWPQAGVDGSSISASFERTFGTEAGRVDCSVEAFACDQGTARVLRIPEGSPVLLVERLIHDVDGRPRELSYITYPANKVAFSVSLPSLRSERTAPRPLRSDP